MNAGDDTIQSSVSYALRRNVERLVLTGFVDLNAWSTPGNPTSYLTGNSGNNVFNGPGTYYDAAGQPLFTASGSVMGYAVMSGGNGDDTYHLRDTVGGQVLESAAQGYDTIVLEGPNWTNYQLPANVEAIVTREGGVGEITGTRTRIGNAADNYIEGARLAAINLALHNLIDGGVGADTMVGWHGNDRFIVDNTGDTVLDRGVFANGAQESTADEVHASVAFELPDNVEILRLTGSTALEARGNDLANTIDGSLNAAANVLAGDLGGDRYVAGANDTIVERPGEGVDTVQWSETATRVYTAADLPDNVEALALADTAGASGFAGDARFDRVTGNASGNALDGGAGDDILDGGAGDDVLIGGFGDDVLNGGAGYDSLRFSRGFGHDQVYGDVRFEIFFDSTITPSDLLFVNGQLQIAGTTDRIEVGYAPTIRFSDGTFLAANDVDAMLRASHSTASSAAADMLTGTAADDVLDALAGDDFLYGRDGADTLSGSAGSDRLHGEGGADTLLGGAGPDQIRGGAGNDSIDGQEDNDTLYGDDGDDVIAGGGGFDLLYGGAGNDTLTLAQGNGTAQGEAGDDQLTGGPNFDNLLGGSGNDRFDGGGSDDYLERRVRRRYVRAPPGRWIGPGAGLVRRAHHHRSRRGDHPSRNPTRAYGRRVRPSDNARPNRDDRRRFRSAELRSCRPSARDPLRRWNDLDAGDGDGPARAHRRDRSRRYPRRHERGRSAVRIRGCGHADRTRRR